MGTSPNELVGSDPDELAAAIRTVSDGIVVLAAPPGALPDVARHELLEQLAKTMDFIEASAGELRTHLRAESARAIQLGPAGSLPRPETKWPHYEEQVGAVYVQVRTLFEKRRQEARAANPDPDVAYERERFVQMMVCMGIERSIYAKLPGRVGNLACYLGLDVERHIDEQGHEPAYFEPSPTRSEGNSASITK